MFFRCFKITSLVFLISAFIYSAGNAGLPGTLGGPCRFKNSTLRAPNASNTFLPNHIIYACNHGLICCFAPWKNNFKGLKCWEWEDYAKNTPNAGKYKKSFNLLIKSFKKSLQYDYNLTCLIAIYLFLIIYISIKAFNRFSISSFSDISTMLRSRPTFPASPIKPSVNSNNTFSTS